MSKKNPRQNLARPGAPEPRGNYPPTTAPRPSLLVRHCVL